MKSILRTVLPALLTCACAFAAVAQEPTAPAVAADANARATQSTDEAGNRDRVADRHCLRATGSRLLALQNAKEDKAGRRCAPGPGRVHTSEDLQHTGAASLGEALRRLETSTP
jgi:hypothetical protein